MECTPTKKGFRRLQVISWLLMGRSVEDVSLLAGFSQRQWTKIGKVRTPPYLGEHIRHNVLGAVRPKDGRISTMLFNLCDSDTFQALLNSMAEEKPAVKAADPCW